MKLAVSTYSLARWRRQNNKTMDDTLAWIAHAGVPGVEFAGSAADGQDYTIDRAIELRRRCEQLGLAIAGYCVGAELLRPSAQQNHVVEELKKQVDLAEALGTPRMRHDVTRGWGDHASRLRVAKTFGSVLKIVVPAIREVADYAQSKHIKTSLENHGFYMQAAQRVEKLIRAVSHPNFGLTIDLGNFLCVNDDPVQAVRRLAKYVIMAHAKDFHVKPKSKMPPTGWFATPTRIALRGAIAGHGELDLSAQLRLLKNAGYDGFLSLEFEGMEDPPTAIRLGLDYLHGLLEQS